MKFKPKLHICNSHLIMKSKIYLLMIIIYHHIWLEKCELNNDAIGTGGFNMIEGFNNFHQSSTDHPRQAEQNKQIEQHRQIEQHKQTDQQKQEQLKQLSNDTSSNGKATSTINSQQSAARLSLLNYNSALARKIGFSTLMMSGVLYSLTVLPALFAITGAGPLAGKYHILQNNINSYFVRFI